MKIFVAASYSTQVNYETGEVFPEYRKWLEDVLATIDYLGHEVFCALRDDQYKINNTDPVTAFKLDMEQLEKCDTVIALLSDKASWGVQTEIGFAIARQKRIILAHLPEHELAYFNAAMLKTGVIEEIELPFTTKTLAAKL